MSTPALDTADPIEEGAALARLRSRLFDAQTPPATLDRYRIDSRIGVGGMGVVYRAHDPQLDRRVAIKVMRELSPAGARPPARLLREAKAAARVSHPNVIEIFDVGSHGASVFVVMEYVVGQTLEQWTGSVRDGLAAYRAAAAGLEAVHAAGLVHRDFKPANVMVAEDGRVLVLDFGLARAAPRLGPGGTADETATASDDRDSAPPFASTTIATRDGVVVGTPVFMAPELFDGAAPDVDTDIYAFCVSLYRTLYRRDPFPGQDVFEVQLAKRRTRPSFEDGPLLPARVVELLRRGLSPRRDMRPHTMAEVIEALTPRRARSRRAATLGLAAAGGGMWLFVQAASGELRSSQAGCDDPASALDGTWDDAQRGAVERQLAALSNVDSAQTVVGLLDDYAEQWRGEYDTACQGEDEVRDLRMACLHDRRMALAAATEVLASHEGDQGRTVDVALQLPSISACRSGLGAKAVGVVDPTRVGAADELLGMLHRADALATSGRRDEATALVDDAADRAQRLGAPDLRGAASLARARLYAASENHDAAIREFRSAYFLGRDAGRSDLAYDAAVGLSTFFLMVATDSSHGAEWVRHASVELERRPSTPQERAFLHLAQGRLAEHRTNPEEVRAAADALGRLLEDESAFSEAERLRLLLGLAELSNYTRRWDRMVPRLQAAIERTESLYGADYHLIANLTHELATALMRTNDYEGAVRAATRSMEVSAVDHGWRSAAVVRSRLNRALFLKLLGRLDEAAADIEAAADVVSELGASNDALAAYVHLNSSAVHRAMGRWHDVLEDCAAAEEVFDAVTDATGSSRATVLGNRARALVELGRFEEAQSVLEAVLTPKMVEATTDLYTANVWFDLARTLHARGDAEGAAAAATRVDEVRERSGETGVEWPDGVSWLRDARAGL